MFFGCVDFSGFINLRIHTTRHPELPRPPYWPPAQPRCRSTWTVGRCRVEMIVVQHLHQDTLAGVDPGCLVDPSKTYHNMQDNEDMMDI